MYRCGSALVRGRELANAAVKHFHQQLNAEEYEGICSEADEGFRTGQSHDELIRFLEAIHKKLGVTAQENQLNLRVDTNTRGTFLTARYRTTFTRGTAIETFSWAKRSSTLKLYAYHVESNALVFDKGKPAAENPGTLDSEGRDPARAEPGPTRAN